MFAGPNGSGKSTIKAVIRPELLGVYINPDEIEKDIRERDFLDLERFQVDTTATEILAFFNQSVLLAQADLLEEAAGSQSTRTLRRWRQTLFGKPTRLTLSDRPAAVIKARHAII
jgi:predicted ABC-type ATPase